VIERNVFLLDTLMNGMQDPEMPDVPVKIFPNPVTAGQNLGLEIDLPVKTCGIRADIVGLNGQLISTLQITERTSEIPAPREEGIYVLRVWMANTRLTSRTFLVKNE
jgi:hypothetical protein